MTMRRFRSVASAAMIVLVALVSGSADAALDPGLAYGGKDPYRISTENVRSIARTRTVVQTMHGNWTQAQNNRIPHHPEAVGFRKEAGLYTPANAAHDAALN